MSTSQYGSTSGSSVRESRPLMERLMVFALEDEVHALHSEQPWQSGDRNSRTLAKDVDFRILLTVLRDGATLTEEDGDARVSVQVLHGKARLEVGDDWAELASGQLAAIDAGPTWRLIADGECAVLTTLAWPGEKDGA